MDWKERLKKIRMVVLDVDGTLTDGGMYYSAEGDVLKRFYVQDGMGLMLLHRAGIEIAFMTSENSPIVSARAKKLRIKHVILGCQAKKHALENLSKQLTIPLEHMAYMGDDVNDEAPMKIAGVAACPSDAVSAIQSISDFVSSKPGGRGAVREFVELVLIAQEKPITLPDVW